MRALMTQKSCAVGMRKAILRNYLKAGLHMKAVLWLGIMALMQISARLRFKQSRISMLITHIYVLGCFVNFLVIFRYIWRYIVFLKGLVKFMETEKIYTLKIWSCFKIIIFEVKN